MRQFFLNDVAGSPLISTRARVRLLRAGGVETGRCGVFPYVRFISGHEVSLADDVFVNAGVVFDAAARIELGRRVAVGPGTSFITSGHQLGPSAHRAGWGATEARPIRVGDGSWVGAGATVLGGVTIGEGCVIGAGAVVTADCEPNGLYVGIPARRQRDLPAT